MLQRVGDAPASPDSVRDADIFISYQRDQAAAAKRLAEALDAPNRRVWIDGHLRADSKWRADIEDKLKRARCVVAIWSRKAATSGWVNYESFRAHQEGKLIAVTFDKINGDELPHWLADQQVTSLRDWKPNNPLHNGWMKISRLVSAKCSQLPDYKFKGWLGGGPTHERVTSLAFHPTEDALLISTGSEGAAATWLASKAKSSGRGGYNEDGTLIPADPVEHGQEFRFQLPQPEGTSAKPSIWRAQYSRDGARAILATRTGEAFVLDRTLRGEPLVLKHYQVCGVNPNLFAGRGGGSFRDGVADACFTPDGDFVTVGGWQAVVWNAKGEPKFGKSLPMPEGAHARLVRAAYSDSLESVVLGDRLGKVRALATDVHNGLYLQIADRDDTNVQFALGPSIKDDKDASGLIAIASESPGDSEVRFHDWRNRELAAPRPKSIFDDAAPIRALAMHPRAPVIAIGSNAVRPRLWDYAVTEPLEMERGGWHERGITALSFSASGKYLAVGSEEGRISIWENIAPVI